MRSTCGDATSKPKSWAWSSTVWNDGAPWSINSCTDPKPDDSRRSRHGGRGRTRELPELAGVSPRDVDDEVRRCHARTTRYALRRAVDDVAARHRASHDRGRAQLVPARLVRRDRTPAVLQRRRPRW